MPLFNSGEAVVLSAFIYSLSLAGVHGSLFDPSAGVRITITDPEGVVVVNAQTMIKDSIGSYYYNFPTTANSPLGTYHVEIESTDISLVTYQKYSFELIN